MVSLNMSTRNAFQETTPASFDKTSQTEAQSTVVLFSEIVSTMKANKAPVERSDTASKVDLPELKIEGLENAQPKPDKSPILSGEVRNEDGSLAFTVSGGKVFDKNGKHFADINNAGGLRFKNEDSDVNREFIKGLRFEGTQNGQSRVFETSEGMAEGKIFLPGKDGKQVEYDVHMGMILDKKTGEQIGILKAPGETADGKLAGGSILRFDTNEEVALRNVKGAVFDLHLMGQRKDVYVKGASLGAADGKSADTGLFNIGGVQSKEVGLISRATKAAKEASGEQKEDAELVIKRASHLRQTLNEMLEKGTSPDARFVQNVDMQLISGEGTLKGDQLAREKHRLDHVQPKLEELPKDTSKIDGWVKLPISEAGSSNKQLEIKNGMIMAEDGKTAIGRIDNADGHITIMDPATGKLSQTSIKDMRGSVWHMQFPVKDGYEKVDWISLGSESGVRSVADLKRNGWDEVGYAQQANTELGETFKSKLFYRQADTNNLDYRMKLDNIVKNGVRSDADLDLVKAGAKEYVRPEPYRDRKPQDAPSIDIPNLSQDNASKVNGMLRIGPESFAIVNGELFQLESKNGELVRAEKSSGKLEPGYIVSLEGREQFSLADQNRVLLQFTLPGDAREHRIIGLGSGHTSESGKWQRGGLVEADQLLNESGQAYVAALNNNIRYFEERPWTTGSLGNAAMGDREGLLKDFANQMEKENRYLKENINELFSDSSFDTSKQSNVQIDHAITSSERLVSNLGWRSKTSEDLANDGIAMQKLVNTSTTMVATTVLTAGVGSVFNAAVSAGRLTQGTAYVLEFGTSTAIGATVKAVGQASETSNWKENAASGALEGAAMAFGNVLGKELGSLSSLKNVKEALELQKAGKALSAEQSVLLNTVVGKLTKAGYSETAITGVFLASKSGDALVRSTAMNAAASIQSHDWSNFNAKTITAGALFDVLSITVGQKAASGLGKIGANEKGVVARVINDMTQSYSNAAMSDVQGAVNQERQRIAKEMGVTPDMVSDETLDKRISWANVLNHVNEAGMQAAMTSPLVTLGTNPLVKMGEHLVKATQETNQITAERSPEATPAPAPAPQADASASHSPDAHPKIGMDDPAKTGIGYAVKSSDSTTEAPSKPNVDHATKIALDSLPSLTIDDQLPTVVINSGKEKRGDKVQREGEEFKVVFSAAGEALLHQRGRGVGNKAYSTVVTKDELSNYDKFAVEGGRNLYRKAGDEHMYEVFSDDKNGVRLLRADDYIVAKSHELVVTKPAANIEKLEIRDGKQTFVAEKQKGSDQPDRIVFPDGKIAEHTVNGWSEYYPDGHKHEGTVSSNSELTYNMTKDGTLVRADGLEEVHYKPDGKTELHADRRQFDVRPDVSPDFVAKVEKAYLELPKPLRQFLKFNGQKVYLGKFSTDVRPDLKGAPPRGWKPGDTITCADGIHCSDKRQIIVAEEYRLSDPHQRIYQKSHRGDGVLRHEAGHAVDQALKYLSYSPEFEAAYKKDIADHVSKLSQAERERHEYFLQTPPGAKDLGSQAGQSEIFAEMLGIMYGGGALKSNVKELPKIFPNVKKLMESKLAQYK